MKPLPRNMIDRNAPLTLKTQQHVHRGHLNVIPAFSITIRGLPHSITVMSSRSTPVMPVIPADIPVRLLVFCFHKPCYLSLVHSPFAFGCLSGSLIPQGQ